MRHKNNDIVLSKNGGKIDLSPGTYGNIVARTGATITFKASDDYFIDKLTSGAAKLNFATTGAAKVRVSVCDEVEFSGRVTFTGNKPTKPSHFLVEAWGSGGTDGDTFEVSNGQWVGDVVLPRGGWHYGSGSSGDARIDGYVWAEHIDLEHNVQGGPIGGPDPADDHGTDDHGADDGSGDHRAHDHRSDDDASHNGEAAADHDHRNAARHLMPEDAEG